MKLNRTYYKYIENELYNYHNNKLELENFKDDIIQGSSYQSGDRVQTSTLSDETATKAVKLTSSVRLNQLTRTIRGIETGINILKTQPEPYKYRLLEMKYFDCQYTDMKIAHELSISMETYYRWKRQIVNLIAINIGLM